MPAAPPLTELVARTVGHCVESHRRLADTVGVLDDESVARPSLLPGWLVGHVLTHLARNADSYVRMLDGAAGGQALEQYAGGHEQRSADIDAGATRPAAEVVADLFAATHRLEAAFDRTTAATWGRHGLIRGDAWPCWTFPRSRWREVEIHHVDLGLAYTAADWSEDYVAVELPGVLATLNDRLVDRGQRARLLAWLLGRGEQPVLTPTAWQSRPDYYYRDL